MRHLNKIVFINSATIRYREVLLDGNVHFIGTQGVGKSTVLRAILFFYNGDTQKLGISREKKIFAEYYFSYTNSYIIYEVQREGGPFTILVMRSGGGVTFRFIDSAYSPEWMLIDNQPLERWSDIRQELDKRGIDSSNRIDRLIDYRDIIYGNPSVQPAYRKYSLLESKQYQNIPRTITNVFLNTKLEANFIKETIIHSLSEDELIIDLLAYRHHLHDFEKEYEDIQTLLQPKIKELAEKIISLFNKTRQRKAEQLQLAAMLGASIVLAEEEQAGQQEIFSSKQALYNNLQKKHEEKENRHQNKTSLIRGSIKSIENSIREAQKKERNYREQGIESILSRFAREQEWKDSATRIINERKSLTAKFDNIEQQFKVLRQQWENNNDQLKNRQTQQEYEITRDFMNRRDRLISEQDKQLQALQELHQSKADELYEQEKSCHDKRSRLGEQRVGLNSKIWRGNEINELKEKTALAKSIAEIASQKIKSEKENLKHLRKEWESEEENLKENKERNQQKLQTELYNLKQELADIESKLSRYQQALYGYLQENYPEWRETIGRIAREEVLFNVELKPVIKEVSNLFFGVELNLQAIENSAKSLDQYESEKKSSQKKIEGLQKELAALDVNFSEDINRLAKRFNPKLREISDLVQRLEIEKQQKEDQVEKGNLQLQEIIRVAQVEKRQTLAQIDGQIAEADSQVQEQQKLTKQHKRQFLEGQKKIRSIITGKVKVLENEKDKKIKDVQNRFHEHYTEAEKQLKDLKQQQQQKLKSAGADTKRLAELDEQLQKVNSELQFIEDNRELVILYRNDKRELFDRIEEFKTEREKELQKIEREERRLIELKQVHRQKLQDLSDAIDDVRDKLRRLKEGFEEFEQFSGSEIYSEIETYLLPKEETGEAYSVRKTIQELRDISHELNSLKENLRDSANRFLSRFSDANLFQFPTQPGSIEDYMRFAANLKEFIDENKIAEYQRRVNSRFASILNSVGKETGDLISREGDIQKIVTRINKDFRERNFVGIIQSMELKVENSSNRVVNTLKRIRDYEQERGFALGEKSLFNYDTGEEHNQRAVEFLRQLNRDIIEAKRDQVSLTDAFDLRFRVVENENDSGWVEKLSNVGSEGTDVLVKAMINILLLNVFKESASRRFKDFRLHCMMDEIGRLHPSNVRGILKFANERNILLINGSPVEQDAMAYRHIYELRKDSQSRTEIKRLITVSREHESTL